MKVSKKLNLPYINRPLYIRVVYKRNFAYGKKKPRMPKTLRKEIKNTYDYFSLRSQKL